MKLSRFDIAVIVILATGVTWFVFWSGDVFMPHSANAENRNALIRFHGAVNVGDDRDAVLQKYWSNQTGHLQLYVGSPERWVVRMPFEFGATDWLLLLEFRNGRVSAVRVRTSDSPRPSGFRPEEAPPDKEGTFDP